MEIKFYNSLTNKVETFKSIKDGEVSMYVCGPTVYNYPHIGNMRPVVVFDTLRKFLSYVGYKVTYVSNFTDVDDKIINKAIEENKTEKELTEFFIEEFKKTTTNIGSLLPSITPKVTEYIDKIIAYIDNLVKLGKAYVIDNDVYFKVSSVSDYGTLSKINLEDLKVGARIEANSKKDSPLDFVLWKKTDKGISWDSPWGKGRPGWHTECCVMIDSIFPNHLIDIHGGGYDLKFPHHENEIAQSMATHNNKIANYWLHNAFINFGDEKMSKSLGNVVLAKDMIANYGGNVTRMVILSAHYRQPVNFTEETISSSKNEISKIENSIKQIALKLQLHNEDMTSLKATRMDNFLNALADDLNTANALMEVYNLVKEGNQLIRNKDIDYTSLKEVFASLLDMLYVLGLDVKYVTLTDEDRKLLEDYNQSKLDKNFTLSDEIRARLINKNIL